MGLSELEMTRLADQLRRAQNYEEAILILFQLRPLVRGEGILDSEIVQAKFFLNLAKQLLVRLIQSNPDKSVLVFELFADVRNLDIRNTQALCVGSAVNYSGALLDCW
jgi:hypothetical protein